jgi:hypothetical protein
MTLPFDVRKAKVGSNLQENLNIKMLAACGVAMAVFGRGVRERLSLYLS